MNSTTGKKKIFFLLISGKAVDEGTRTLVGRTAHPTFLRAFTASLAHHPPPMPRSSSARKSRARRSRRRSRSRSRSREPVYGRKWPWTGSKPPPTVVVGSRTSPGEDMNTLTTKKADLLNKLGRAKAAAENLSTRTEAVEQQKQNMASEIRQLRDTIIAKEEQMMKVHGKQNQLKQEIAKLLLFQRISIPVVHKLNYITQIINDYEPTPEEPVYAAASWSNLRHFLTRNALKKKISQLEMELTNVQRKNWQQAATLAGFDISTRNHAEKVARLQERLSELNEQWHSWLEKKELLKTLLTQARDTFERTEVIYHRLDSLIESIDNLTAVDLGDDDLGDVDD